MGTQEILALLCPCCFWLVIIGAMFAGMYKVFEKAGRPGWEGLVPIYNQYILTVEIAKKEILWFVLLFVPIVGIVAWVMTCIELAKKFGKSDGYGIALGLLSPIMFPILGFSDAKYVGGRGGNSRRRDDDDYDDEPRPRGRQRDDYDD